MFAPLEGITARKMLHDHLGRSTFVLLEIPPHRKWIRGKAVFRILWLLGGKWKWIGWMHVIPFLNLFYRLVAAYRGLFFRVVPSTTFEKFKDRFLP